MHRVRMEDWICREEGLPCLTEETLHALQLKKLNILLKKLREKGGIYEDLSVEVKNLKELQNLPLTDSTLLRERPSQFLACSQSQVSRIITEATSGTTGGAKRVFYTEEDLRHTVGFFASGISEMLNKGEKCLIAFPFSGPSGLGDLIAKAVESLGAIPIKAGFGQSYGSMISLIEQEQPETYIGFSVPLLSVFRLYPGEFPIKRALLSGDSCPDGVMKALPMPLYPHYGSRETALGGAVTCPAFQGMHLRENHILAEIIDPAGTPVPDGEWGELVITTIGMEAMPLLRYRTGDTARFLPEKCPCGGITRRLDRVTRAESGPVSMENLDSCLFSIPEVIDFRAFLGNKLRLEIYSLRKDIGVQIQKCIAEICPQIPTEIILHSAGQAQRPAYPGKRHILKEEG